MSRKLSVIVTSYNQPQLLELVLRRLAEQQEAPPFEVLVADDGSSDDVLSVTRAQADRHRLDVRFVWQPDRSFRLSRARNNAIRCATGDLLVFLDGDMWIPRQFLRQQADAHDGSRRVVCATRLHVDLQVFPRLGGPDEIALMQAHSWNAERAKQLAATRGPSPWMAMVGFGSSVPRAPEVLFDEGIEGWGSEDRELAMRLFHRHGYEFVCPEAAPPLFHLTRRQGASHERIVEGIRNKLYLLSRYSWDEAAPALEVMRFFRLDPATNRWSFGRGREEPLPQVVRDIEDWMRAQGFTAAA